MPVRLLAAAVGSNGMGRRSSLHENKIRTNELEGQAGRNGFGQFSPRIPRFLNNGPQPADLLPCTHALRASLKRAAAARHMPWPSGRRITTVYLSGKVDVYLCRRGSNVTGPIVQIPDYKAATQGRR